MLRFLLLGLLSLGAVSAQCSEPLYASQLSDWTGIFDIPVFDTQMYLTNLSALDYTFAEGSVDYFNWTVDEYYRATRNSVLPVNWFIHMGLEDIPADQYIEQSIIYQDVADELILEDASFQMRGIVTIFSVDLLRDAEAFGDFINEVEKEVPLNVGYRCQFSSLADGMYLPGLRLLADRNQTFDYSAAQYEGNGTWITNITKLQELAWVAEMVPDLILILDHMGFQGEPGGVVPDYDDWAAAMLSLKNYSNVYIKVSPGALGINVMRPYFYFVINNFGYERSLYGSNHYKVTVQDGIYSYNYWAAAVSQYLIELNATEAQAEDVLYRTAVAAYNPNFDYASGSSLSVSLFLLFSLALVKLLF